MITLIKPIELKDITAEEAFTKSGLPATCVKYQLPTACPNNEVVG